MSLINQMLRDLEERRADELTRQNLQREIRPLPPMGKGGKARYLVLTLVALALFGIGGWQVYEYVVATQTVTSGPPVPTVSMPAVPPPAVAAPVVALPADAMLPREIEAPAGVDGLRLTVALQNVPAEQPAVAEPSGVAPAAPSIPAPAASEAPKAVVPLPVPTKAAPKAAEAPAASASIEKSASLATPRERAEAEYRRALAAAASGKAGEAVDALQAALRQDGGHVPARQSLIRALIDSRRGEEAESLLRDGLELQPAQIGWAMTLARLQVERNDLPGALKTLGRSAPHAIRSADYQGFFGHLEYRLGHPQEAVALYQAATRLAPGEGRWWLGLGLALEAGGHAGEAREAFRKALATGNLNSDLAAIAEQKGH